MKREDALAKIAKCLRLSKSANEHEAAAALRQAQALMREHGLSGDDVALADVREVGTEASKIAVNLWDQALARLVAEATGCDFFNVRGEQLVNHAGWPTARRFRKVVFVGLHAAPDVATYAYDVLSRQCIKARLAFVQKQTLRCKPITRTARGDEFALGWVAGVRRLVQTFAGRSGDQLLIEQYIKARHPDLKTGKPRNTAVGRNVQNAAAHGFRAGQAAQLDRGIGASNAQAQLGHTGSES